MKLHSLKPAKGSVKAKKRIGRGQGSGMGGTSTKGHKGAQSRSGYSKKPGFEGGQMPLQRRVPKFGFKSPNRVENKPVKLGMIQEFAENNGLDKFTLEDFHNFGLASKRDRIKVLCTGEIKRSIEITAHAFSATAKAAIENAGGKAVTV